MLRLIVFVLIFHVIYGAPPSPDAFYLTSEQMKEIFCPKCEMLTESFSKWILVTKKDKDTKLYKTNINESLPEGQLMFSGDNYYGLRLYPIFKDGDFADYLAEFSFDKQIKLWQFDQKFGDKPYCFIPTVSFPDVNVQKSFTFGPYLSTGRTRVIDVETACSTDCYNLTRLIDVSDEKFFNLVQKCWDNNNIVCGVDVDDVYQLKTIDNADIIAYYRHNITVYGYCFNKFGRCAYYIYDHVTGGNYYIPDEIPVTVDGGIADAKIEYLVPLINKEDRYFSERTTTTSIPRTTTTPEYKYPADPDKLICDDDHIKQS